MSRRRVSQRVRALAWWAVASGICLLLLALGARPAGACLWDYDTFKEESIGKRELAEVVSGDLQKHSRAFYEAKVTYTRPIIERGAAPMERYDDLAVALAKLGQLDEAIAVLGDKEKKFPGEYTTLANWGTFLAMKGDLAGALDKLRAAVAKRPDAHFGREVFQLQLLEFALRAQKDPSLPERENFLGLEMNVGNAGIRGTSQRKVPAKDRQTPVPAKAIEALTGMIRFGEAQDLPMVWSALGWALAWQGDTQLAIRALRRAELLGDAKAGVYAGAMAMILRDLKLRPECCPEPGHPSAVAAWATVGPKLDREWAAGAKKTARRQAAEERKLARRQWKAAFGY